MSFSGCDISRISHFIGHYMLDNVLTFKELEVVFDCKFKFNDIKKHLRWHLKRF